MSSSRNGSHGEDEPDATPNGTAPTFPSALSVDQELKSQYPGDEREQTAADADQTLSDSDQTASEEDQATSDMDQTASEEDQLASDRESSDDADQADRDRSTRGRNHATHLRAVQAQARLRSASAREEQAEVRDLVASERDQLAEERDAAAKVQDEIYPPEQRARRARDRERAASDRAHAARDRQRAASDRVRAAMERTTAMGERTLAAADKAKLAASETDELTGVRRRGAGLEQLQREIIRARRTPEELIVAFVDVDGLKRTNDTWGHAAGDSLLCMVATSLRRAMRPHDLVMRYGGDEFVCVLPNANLDQIRRRFDDVSAELSSAPTHGSVTAGFAKLAEGDSAMDLINRADRDLLAQRQGV
jgi:diguanylate cyclase (GGDEF)-like protein